HASFAGANLIHRIGWKYLGWLHVFSGGLLRMPQMRLNPSQMRGLRAGLTASGYRLPETDDEFIEGRFPEEAASPLLKNLPLDVRELEVSGVPVNMRYQLQKLIREIARNPETRAKFLANPDQVMASYPLTDEEKSALRDRDFGKLYSLVVHGLLLRPFAIIFSIPEKEYLVEIRRRGDA